MFLQSIKEVRAVRWSKAHLWDIKIETEAPVAPFDQWFPATDVEDDRWTMQNFDFTLHNTIYTIPQGSNQKLLRVTFADDVFRTIEVWLDDWVSKGILNNGEFITPVLDAMRRITILRLDELKNPINELTRSYWIVPQGSYNFNGRSESESGQNTVEFIKLATLES